MILIDSGSLSMDSISLFNLSQSQVLSLVDLTSVTTNLNRLSLSLYDKTFITAATSNLNFTNSQVTGFVQTNTSLVFASLVLSLTTSSLNVSNSSFVSLESAYSSPVISIVNA